MAYTKSELEKLASRRGPSPVSIMWRLLMLSIVVFFTVTAFYVGVEFGYLTFLKGQIEKTESDRMALGQEISREEWDSLLDFYSRLDNVRRLLDDHIYAGKGLEALEERTVNRVFVRNVKIDNRSGNIEVEAVAGSWLDLSRQLEAWRVDERAGSVALTSSRATTEGLVDFSFEVGVNPNFFLRGN